IKKYFTFPNPNTIISLYKPTERIKKMKNKLLKPLLVIIVFSQISCLAYLPFIDNSKTAKANIVKRISIKKGKGRFIFKNTKNKKIVKVKNKNPNCVLVSYKKKNGKKAVYVDAISGGSSKVVIIYKFKGKEKLKMICKIKVSTTGEIIHEPPTESVTSSGVKVTSTPTVAASPTSTVAPNKSTNPNLVYVDKGYDYDIKVVHSSDRYLYNHETIPVMIKSNDPDFRNYFFGLISVEGRNTKFVDSGHSLAGNLRWAEYKYTENTNTTSSVFTYISYEETGEYYLYLYKWDESINKDVIYYESPFTITLHDVDEANDKWLKETVATVTKDKTTEKEKAYALRDFILDNFDYTYRDEDGNYVDFCFQDNKNFFNYPSIDCIGAHAIFKAFLEEAGISSEAYHSSTTNPNHVDTKVNYSDGTTEVLRAQPLVSTGAIKMYDDYYEFTYTGEKVDKIDPLTAPEYTYTGDGNY
nr:hypothetical protein [Lachnospiraceae bacterium]